MATYVSHLASFSPLILSALLTFHIESHNYPDNHRNRFQTLKMALKQPGINSQIISDKMIINHKVSLHKSRRNTFFKSIFVSYIYYFS